jgi:hypothetical protein
MRRIGWIVAAAALAQAVQAQVCQPQQLPSMGSGVSRVELLGSTILTGESHRGLGIFDRTDPLSPEPVGLYRPSGSVQSLTIADGRAYVSVGGGVVQILDVADPRSPAPLGSFEVVDSAGYVAVSGRLAFVGAPSGLWMFEVSDPTAPYLAGIVEEGAPGHMVTSGSYLYMAMGLGGVKIVDFSNWLDLRVVGSLPVPGKVVDHVAVANGILYAATTEGIEIIDVTDPTQPALLGTTPPGPIEVFDAQVSGDVAIAVSIWEGLWLYDVSNPAAPTLLSTLDTPGDSYSARIDGNLVYVADGHRGVSVVDITDPSAPALVSPGDYFVPQSPFGITVRDGIAYIADGAGGLTLMDVTDPALTRGLGAITGTNWFAKEVALSGDLAFLARYGGTRIINIASPTAPALVGTAEGGSASAIAASGDALYVSGFVVDVSDPAAPVNMGRLLNGGDGLAVEGDRLYSTNGNALFIYGIADPLNPVLLGTGIQGGLTKCVALDGGRAITGGYSGVALWDVRDASSPTLLGTWAAPYAIDVALSGDIAAVVQDNESSHILDVSDPRAPVLLEALHHEFGIPVAAQVTADAAYVAYEYANMQVLDLRSCRRCGADLNGDVLADTADLLVYLDRWFAADLLADIDAAVGVDVFDLLAFLDRWFVGCGA